MVKRANKTELQYRLDTLMGLKAQGHSTSALVKAGVAYWQVSEREVLRYLAKLKAMEAQMALAEPFDNWGQYKVRFEYLYAQALAEKNLALAHEILSSHVKLEQTRTKVKDHGDRNAKSTSLISLPESNELERLLGLFKAKTPSPPG